MVSIQNPCPDLPDNFSVLVMLPSGPSLSMSACQHLQWHRNLALLEQWQQDNNTLNNNSSNSDMSTDTTGSTICSLDGFKVKSQALAFLQN